MKAVLVYLMYHLNRLAMQMLNDAYYVLQCTPVHAMMHCFNPKFTKITLNPDLFNISPLYEACLGSLR